MLINQFTTFLSNKSVLYLFSVIDDSSVTFFGQYHLLRIICLYKIKVQKDLGMVDFQIFVASVSIPALITFHTSSRKVGANTAKIAQNILAIMEK